MKIFEAKAGDVLERHAPPNGELIAVRVDVVAAGLKAKEVTTVLYHRLDDTAQYRADTDRETLDSVADWKLSRMVVIKKD